MACSPKASQARTPNDSLLDCAKALSIVPTYQFICLRILCGLGHSYSATATVCEEDMMLYSPVGMMESVITNYWNGS